MHHEPLVLIVDDDPDMRELIETLFKLIGFATFQARNNTEALAQALTHHPDLITTDMFRPRVDLGSSSFNRSALSQHSRTLRL